MLQALAVLFLVLWVICGVSYFKKDELIEPQFTCYLVAACVGAAKAFVASLLVVLAAELVRIAAGY